MSNESKIKALEDRVYQLEQENESLIEMIQVCDEPDCPYADMICAYMCPKTGEKHPSYLELKREKELLEYKFDVVRKMVDRVNNGE